MCEGSVNWGSGTGEGSDWIGWSFRRERMKDYSDRLEFPSRADEGFVGIVPVRTGRFQPLSTARKSDSSDDDDDSEDGAQSREQSSMAARAQHLGAAGLQP